MAKHKLQEEEAAPRVAVVGLSSHVADYRLCWSLNRALGLSLTRRRNDIVEIAKDKELHYTVFHQADDDGAVLWSLVANTCGKRKLLPGQKEADFFLVADRSVGTDAEELVERIRGAEFVLTAFALNMEEMRMGHKLLL